MTEAEQTDVEKLEAEAKVEANNKVIAEKAEKKAAGVRFIHYRVGFITGASGQPMDEVIPVNVPLFAVASYLLGRSEGHEVHAGRMEHFKTMSERQVQAEWDARREVSG